MVATNVKTAAATVTANLTQDTTTLQHAQPPSCVWGSAGVSGFSTTSCTEGSRVKAYNKPAYSNNDAVGSIKKKMKKKKKQQQKLAVLTDTKKD